MKVIAATTLAQMALAITVDKSTVPALIADNTGCTDADKGLSCYEDAHCAPCGQKCDLSNKTMAITGLEGEGTCNYGCTADDDCNGFVCSKDFCVPPSDNSGDTGCTDENKGLGCFEDKHCEHCHQVCDFKNTSGATLKGEGTCNYKKKVAEEKKEKEGVCAERWPEAEHYGAFCKGCIDLKPENCNSRTMRTARSCTTNAECGEALHEGIAFCYNDKTPKEISWGKKCAFN